MIRDHWSRIYCCNNSSIIIKCGLGTGTGAKFSGNSDQFRGALLLKELNLAELDKGAFVPVSVCCIGLAHPFIYVKEKKVKAKKNKG